MAIRSQKLAYLARSTFLILAVGLLSSGAANAQRAGSAFERLSGRWTGSGTIDLANGSHEPLRCRAAYDLLAEQRKLELNIRCASDSYNFDLFSSVVLAGRSVSGTWSESTRSAAGTISGTAEGDRIQVNAESPGFSANLTVTTRGNHQTVSIRTPDASASIKSVMISLRRRS